MNGTTTLAGQEVVNHLLLNSHPQILYPLLKVALNLPSSSSRISFMNWKDCCLTDWILLQVNVRSLVLQNHQNQRHIAQKHDLHLDLKLKLMVLCILRWQIRLELQFYFSISFKVYLQSLDTFLCKEMAFNYAYSPISLYNRSQIDFQSSYRFCWRFRTIFSTSQFSIYRNLRHRTIPILLRPCSTCSASLIFWLNWEIRSAGLGKGIALFDLLIILEALALCLSLEIERSLSTLCRVVLVVFLECLPERVLDRSRVCVVFCRQGANLSGERSLSQRQLLRLYFFRCLRKSSRLRSWCLCPYFLLVCLCITTIKQTISQKIKQKSTESMLEGRAGIFHLYHRLGEILQVLFEPLHMGIVVLQFCQLSHQTSNRIQTLIRETSSNPLGH